jgi:hypothetical protein
MFSKEERFFFETYRTNYSDIEKIRINFENQSIKSYPKIEIRKEIIHFLHKTIPPDVLNIGLTLEVFQHKTC